MKRLFRESDGDKYCLRRICGFMCVLSGIIVIMSKVYYFMFTGIITPFEGRGTTLIQTGTVLLGVVGLDPLFNNIGNKNKISSVTQG